MVDKVTKNKGFFPTDDSLFKMLYLDMMDITRKWTGRRRDWGEIHSQLEIFVIMLTGIFGTFKAILQIAVPDTAWSHRADSRAGAIFKAAVTVTLQTVSA